MVTAELNADEITRLLYVSGEETEGHQLMINGETWEVKDGELSKVEPRAKRAKAAPPRKGAAR